MKCGPQGFEGWGLQWKVGDSFRWWQNKLLEVGDYNKLGFHIVVEVVDSIG